MHLIQPEERSELFWMLSDSWIMAKRSVLHITRSFDQVFSLILFPIMFMLLNRYVLGGAIDTGDVSYANFLFAGILVQTLAFGANYTTINLAVDMQEGIIDRFRSLPMNGSALIVGHILADMVRNIISGIIIVHGWVFGWVPADRATVFEWLQVIALALVFTLAISWVVGHSGVNCQKHSKQHNGPALSLIFPLTFVSSAFVPTVNHAQGSALFC